MVSKVVNDSALKLIYLVGVTDDGGDITNYQRFSNIDIDATSENLYAVAKAIGTLLAKPLKEVLLEEDSSLIESEE